MSDDKLIIGFCGYARCGKDTACNYLIQNNSKTTKIYSFADSLRDFAFHLDSYLPEMKMYYRDVIDSYGYEEAKDRFPAFRRHLVRIGNGARETISKDIWLNAVKEKIANDDVELALIKDVRYFNEADFIIRNGGIVIYIDRKDIMPANSTEEKSIQEILTKLKQNINFKIVENKKGDLDIFRRDLFRQITEL